MKNMKQIQSKKNASFSELSNPQSWFVRRMNSLAVTQQLNNMEKENYGN
jgi:hypothetical protein